MGFQSFSSVHYIDIKNNYIYVSYLPFISNAKMVDIIIILKRKFDATIILLIPLIYELDNLNG